MDSGYLQIGLDERDKHKTSFSALNNKWQYTRMVFGLKGAPSNLQKKMHDVLRGIKCACVYMDNFLCWSDLIDEHEKLLDEIMESLREHRLCVQIDKLEIFKDKVCYLGHMISKNGIEVNPEKVRAVQDFPKPKNVKNIRQFLGVVNFYRKFLPRLASIAKPLTTLLKKDKKFKWTDATEKSFNQLKNWLCFSPILRFPDMNLPYIITCDASGYGISAVLAQK